MQREHRQAAVCSDFKEPVDLKVQPGMVFVIVQ